MLENKNDRLVRIKAIVGKDGALPISKSTWWDGVSKGYFPQPVKLGPKTTAWRWSDIQALVENGISVEALDNV